jgi:hypothetical protein
VGFRSREAVTYPAVTFATSEIGVKGRPRRINVVVEKVEIDPVLDDARFRMPEASR